MTPFAHALFHGANAPGLWSNPATWGGAVPGIGGLVGVDVTIPTGRTVIQDIAVNVGCLMVSAGATLNTQDVDLALTASCIENMGTWNIGSVATPYTHAMVITLNGARTVHTARPSVNGFNQGYTNDGTMRCINNMGVRRFIGTPKGFHITKLNATALAGVTSITVKDNVTDWKTGDSIVIAPTNFYGQSTSERVTLTANGVSAGGGNYTLTFTPALTEKHWGVLQYPIDAAYGTNAMSLTPGTFTANAAVPTVLDCRAEVLNLSAGNIVIQSVNDTAWSTQGWGVMTVDMPGSTFNDVAVRVVRGGQRGAIGCYPFHSHMLSYADISAPVTVTVSSGAAVVNWTGHGITPPTPLTSTVTFSTSSGFLQCSWPGSSSFAASTRPISFSGGSLPTGITAGVVYYIAMAGGGALDTFFLNTTSTDVIGASTVPYTNSGSGTITANSTVYLQPVQFSTTGALPTGIVAGTIYYTVGCSITPNSFSICSTDDTTFYQTVLAPIIASGSQSGVHTATLTRFTADHPESYRRYCVVDISENRGFTTHGTCGTEISNCISYDTKGMTFFLENGSEERCNFSNNFALKVRNPAITDCLKLFDSGGEPAGDGATFSFSSGHWFTNLNNTIVNNQAADCAGFAVWNSLALHCFDNSALVAINPNITPLLTWSGNGGHSNQKRGVSTGIGVVNSFGSVSGGAQSTRYSSPTVGVMSGMVMWKNNQGGYSNLAANTHYRSLIAADNFGGDFEGGMLLDATMLYTLLVGQSLNDGQLSTILSDYDGTTTAPRFGVASYHYTWMIKECAFQNYPWVDGQYKRGGQQDYGGGAFNTRDLYTLPIDMQSQFMTGLRLNNSHAGFMSRAPRYSGYPITLTIANPCVLDVGPGAMTIENNEPFYFTATSGALPAAFALDTTYYAVNVSGTTCNLALTSGGAAVSTLGQTQSGSHTGMPMWRGTGINLNFNIASVRLDNYQLYGAGSTGATQRFVTHNRPYFSTGAANVINADPLGRAISTTTGFVGFGNFVNELHLSSLPEMGIKSERLNPTTEALIDKFEVGPSVVAGVTSFFQSFEHVALQDGARFRITHPAYAFPKVMYAARIVGGQRAASTILIELPWDGTIAIGTVARASTFGVQTTIPTITVTATDGSAILCTAATGATRAAKIAAVSADATGSLYYQDTANNSVFVRHTPVPRKTADVAAYAALPETNIEKADESTYIILRA